MPQHIQERLSSVCKHVAKNGYKLITGAAVGVDQFSVISNLDNENKNITLYLPWNNYESEFIYKMQEKYYDSFNYDNINKIVYDSKYHQKWLESVYLYHPKPDILGQGMIKLHARNYGIVSSSDLVIALPNINKQGGTNQGMRIAEAINIPLYDITNEKHWNLIKKEI